MCARLLTLLLATALLPAVLACAGAVEPSGGPTPGTSAELRAYFGRMGTLATTLRQDTRPLFVTLASSTDLDLLKSAFAELRAELAQYVEDAQAIEPPAEAQVAHNEVITAAQAFVYALAYVDDEVQRVTTLSEFDEAAGNDALPPASETLKAACLALQQIGQDSGLEVDLGCGAV